jgi:ATP-dependent Zn protease
MNTSEPQPPDAALLATAYHEAGHAVMALAVGRVIERVTIVPGKMQTGHATLGLCKVQKTRTRASKDWLEDEMLILLAGMVAEAQFTGEYCTAGAQQDLRAVRRLAETRGGRQVERLERRALDKAESILADEQHWSAVEAIVKQLLEHQTISGRAARHLFEQAVKED